jgi:serine/threonine protein kinase
MISPYQNGRFKVTIIDFGAVANPQVQGGGSTVAGTFGYMPPEQLMGNPEPASDIYALGALAVQLFTGIPPADLPQKDFHLIFEPQMQSYPVEVVNTLRSMLEPDPNKRLKDHNELLRLFNAFKNNIYESGGSRQNALPLAVFDKKLLEVQSYGDPGNLELWQELSETLPRPFESVPPSYLNIANRNRNPDKCYFSEKLIFSHSSLSRKNDSTPKGCLIGLLELVIIALGFGVVAGYIYYLIKGGEGNVVTFLIFMFIFFMYLLFALKSIGTINRTLGLTHKILLPSEFTHFRQNLLDALLTNGRKTIATIVDVKYIEAEPSYLEIDEDLSHIDTVSYCYHAAPTFKIDYKFNPPDDESAEDLIHTIYTHIPPEGRYKVGDPLPILYRIYKDHYDFEFVDSMPFPLPIFDIFLDYNAFYHISSLERVQLTMQKQNKNNSIPSDSIEL